jgi:hypothetical protein
MHHPRFHRLVRFVLVSVSILLIAAACQSVQTEGDAASSAAVSTTEPTAMSDATAAPTPTIASSETPTSTIPTTTTLEITSTAPVTGPVGNISGSEASEEQLAAGLAAYRKYYCGVCHTLDAAGTAGAFGPIHNGIGATAALRIQDPNYTGKATTPEEYIHESIVDPAAHIAEGFALTSHRMPPYAQLPAEELDALVLFLLHQ